jgi:hypothetical protein
MCIAILNPTKVTLKKNVLKTCWDNNKDGAGMLYLQNGVLSAYKEMDSFDRFYDHYAWIRKTHRDSQIVLHFRISTHGKVDLENCHPFMISEDWGFVHNGIISNAERHVDYSDTNMFNRNVLRKLPPDWIHNDAMYELVCGYIGSSKLLFLNKDNEAYIVNEDWGVWDLGCWFSNKTYKESKYFDYGGKSMLKHTSTTTTTTKSVSTKADWDSWDDYDLTSWERDWEKEYKYNEATKTYDKRVDVDLEEDDDDLVYSPNSWDYKHEEVFSDICESCLETRFCKYDYNYDAPVCKDCSKALYEDVPF